MFWAKAMAVCVLRDGVQLACSLQLLWQQGLGRAINAQMMTQRRALVCACKRVPNLIVLLREPNFSS